MAIDLSDDREYAWLLHRSDTLTQEFIKVWQSVPIRSESKFSVAIGYPARFVVLSAFLLVAIALMLGILIAAAQIPVAIFAFIHSVLPDAAWLIVLGTAGLTLAGYLLYVIGVWFQAAAEVDESASAAPLSVSARSGDEGEWDPWQSLHTRHESARSGLFAGLSIAIGVIIQCTAVVLGPRYFEGAVESPWAWPVLFGEQLFGTMLLGIPGSVLPTFAPIQPSATPGRLLTVGVDVFYVAGVIAMAVLVLSSALKIRELFNGTVRDLADYLENFDISGTQRLMIHRVAVLRPLDENEVISLSKEAFFDIVKTGKSRIDEPSS